MKKSLQLFSALFALMLFSTNLLTAQSVDVAPVSCYPQYTSAGDMDDAAAADHTNQPFATWVAAHTYAISKGINEINFAAGTYIPGTDGAVSDWGNASTGPVIPIGMTVNGNGAVIDNSANGSSQICFATIGGNGATIDGFTWVGYTGNSNGALGVAADLTGWTISNCNFDHSDWAGDALLVNMGTTGQGTITGCNFYNNIQSTGSALNILGSSTAGTDLDIINCDFSCNLRIVSGGAVKIEQAVNVDFSGCTFSGNEANASIGGAVVIRNNADVDFQACNFTCNLTSGGTNWDGGAVAIESGSTVNFNACNFTGNGGDNTAANSPVGPADGVGDPTYGYTRYGGAIYASSQAASIVNLTITGSTFDGNLCTSRGGAIRAKDANLVMTNNYFIGNKAGGGGALAIETGGPPAYPTANAIATTDINNNTFSGNTAGGSGNDIYTEIDICGTNDLEFLGTTVAVPTEYAFVDFCRTDDFNRANSNTVGNGWTETEPAAADAAINGEYMKFDNAGPVFATRAATEYTTAGISTNAKPITWTYNFGCVISQEGFDGSDDGNAFILGATNPDFTLGEGYAVTSSVNNNDNVSIVRYSGGMDADANITVLVEGPALAYGSAAVKVIYTPSTNTWTLYADVSTSSTTELDTDPRALGSGTAYTVVDNTYTGAAFDLSSFGCYYKGSSTSSTRYVNFNNIAVRLGDETCGTGWSGTYAAMTCPACISTPTVADVCTEQGSIAGTVWGDTEATPDGVDNNSTPIAGVTVTLYDAAGMVVATVTTDASGNYFFGGLTYGEGYSVGFSMPGGYTGITNQDDPDATTSTDSDIGSSFQTGLITICPSCSSTSIDAVDGLTGSAHYEQVDAGFVTVPVPVEMLSFTATGDKCTTTLDWTTASESNNDYFEILRSFNGSRFESIAKVKGAGNSSSINDYSFVDTDAKFRTYYQIAQVDFDGTRNLVSEVLNVQLDDCNNRKAILNTMPNPTRGSTIVQIALPINQSVNVVLMDMIGKEVKSISYDLNSGINDISLSLGDLDNGTYILIIKDQMGSYIDGTKLIKM